MMNMTRPLYEIADEITSEWKLNGKSNISPYAKPYLEAMRCLETVNQSYCCESGRSVVLYFLSNAQSFRGEAAKRIKAELKQMLVVK
jgi:hypothetical protein